VADPIGEPPRTLDTTTWPGDTEAEALLGSFGYAPARYYLTMVIHFAATVPAPAPLPAGIEVRSLGEGDDEPLFAAYLESFAEHWGFEHPPATEWWAERRFRPSAGFDPGLWLVAVEDGEIVGFVVARAQEDADGVRHGYVGDVGVRPAWRGRRVAEALLTRSLATFAGRGLPYASLHVDAENVSGALRLYTKVGMEPRPSFTIWQRPLG
jgi:ribosomal protein S18 acetylase RimI-like enzyme